MENEQSSLAIKYFLDIFLALTIIILEIASHFATKKYLLTSSKIMESLSA